MESWIVTFIVVDLIITAVVVFFVIRARAARALGLAEGGSLLADLKEIGALTEFAKTRHERIAEYVRSNWSGIPDQLPRVLSSLVDQLEHEAQAQGHHFSRDLLKTLVATSLRQWRVVPGDQVGTALDKVA